MTNPAGVLSSDAITIGEALETTTLTAGISPWMRVMQVLYKQQKSGQAATLILLE